MSLSAKTLSTFQKTYHNISKANTTINNSKIGSVNKKNYGSNSNSSGPKTYILEGGIIKVYITDENGIQKCVKQMPLEAAPLSILLQVKASNLSDAMMLQDAIEAKLKDENTSSNYTSFGDSPEFSDK